MAAPKDASHDGVNHDLEPRGFDAGATMPLDAAAPSDAAAASNGEQRSGADAAGDDADGGSHRDVPAGPPTFCGRANDDVSTLFCASTPPNITSLSELIRALKLDTPLLLGHSTGLGGRLVSPINPRVVFLRLTNGYAAAAFVRGEQRVELLSLDRSTKRFNLYLLEFAQACNLKGGGCTNGDRFTPSIERDWIDLRVRDDEDLKNTADDCRRCHGGAPHEGGRPMLLMRELASPWVHWFSTQFSALQTDLKAAKGSELYAGVTQVRDPGALENLIRNAERDLAQPPQPLIFNGIITLETKEHQTLPVPGDRGPGADNPDLAPSPTWQLLYADYLHRASPAPPYHHERVTDPTKLQAATTAYQAFLAGQIDKDELPDISDVLPDDQHRLSEMSFSVEPDATDRQLLIQACGACHNASLDHTLTRANFDADLSRVKPDELEVAITRLQLSPSEPGAMPPPSARWMSSGQRSALIAYLRAVDPTSVSPWPKPQMQLPAYSLELKLHLQSADYPGGQLVVGDLTGDDRTDLVAPPRILVQSDDGTLADPVMLPASPLADSAVVDVNADGRLDIVSHGARQTNDINEPTGLLTFLSAGGLIFSAGIASPGPDAFALSTASFTDVNFDGHLDLVSLTSRTGYPVVQYLGDGQGSFSPAAVPMDDAAQALYAVLTVGDVTGDGIADLVLIDGQSPAGVAVYAHDGAAGYTRTAMRYPMSCNTVSRPHIAVGDANGDGRNDVALSVDVLGCGTRLLLQDEHGSLGSAPMIDGEAGPSMFADMNRDGRQDLVVLSTSRGEVRVLLQGDAGLHHPQTLAFRIPSTPGSVLDMLSIGDLDSDSCPDVAVARNGSIIVMRGTGCP